MDFSSGPMSTASRTACLNVALQLDNANAAWLRFGLRGEIKTRGQRRRQLLCRPSVGVRKTARERAGSVGAILGRGAGAALIMIGLIISLRRLGTQLF